MDLDTSPSTTSTSIIIHSEKNESTLSNYIPPIDSVAARNGRTSQLSSPTLQLQGHVSTVLGVTFDSSGTRLASCSKDRTALLWRVHGEAGSNTNYCVLRGHKNAVTQIAWFGTQLQSFGGDDENSDAQQNQLVTSSADCTAAIWDAESGTRIRSLTGHEKCVNGIAAANVNILATASDDGSARVWDARSRSPAHIFPGNFPLVSVALSSDGSSLYTAGVEGIISQWELRSLGTTAASSPFLKLAGHSDTITSISLAPTDNVILSFAMDNTLRAWDVRPVPTTIQADTSQMGQDVDARCIRVFSGASNNFEQLPIRCGWAGGSERVCCGSADRMAYVWDYETGKLMYALPGHTGVVTSVAYSPREDVIASSGTDKMIWIGELSI